MSSEKTLPPTSKKIRDAREEGQVAKSNELAAGVQLAVILLYLYIFGSDIWHDLSELLILTINQIGRPLPLAFSSFISALGSFILNDLACMFLILFFASIAAYVGQIGFLFSGKAMMPKLDKLDVVKNLKNIFSVRSLVELIKNLVKMTVIGFVFYYLFIHYAPSLINMVYVKPAEAMQVTMRIIFWLWGVLVLCYIIFFLADYAFQRHELMKNLKMSHEEVKQEYKDMEGDPEIKNQRNSLQREMQSGSLANTVKKSSAVIKNPTHLAICIYYNEETTPLPKVVAKGVDHLALRMIEIAEKEGVPVIENIPLAHGLNNAISINEFITPPFFSAISEILLMIKMRG
ncbi:TPA: EscU/YscU/HrcU family type III secretion system export apparatus switch protein [Citrobacter werkmanii]